MEKKIINPWNWQEARNYVQAVEIKHANSTLYVSGQCAISDDGVSSTADMRTQIFHTIENLGKVIQSSGYEARHLVRLNIYTTDSTALFENFDVIQDWITKNKVKQTSTVLEVKTLFETLKVELEATLVK
ncbi:MULTISPECIES: RidA family protein [Sphingobacterium]|jgi:enamine deaminase RidA (YjgF/YER057c/UK114 family)|uniref:Putative endoribonuclease L-PSP n=1 Tax=Sphingobacterium multivorum TaxID=28454 RepID=A0A2X2J1W3_SPHMU|nr:MULTISPECIES: RidA family protein [Sphingobacterium]QQT45363.1 RidA family protein [Sphingobacterium multivorum]QQT61999.1 RidA family protein [Sphingobacterium multivorum]QRQ63828.1 RidA family protein [Sphingobacterium multivorum]SPZ85553.1 putative endoribonuclease L-PSP [Sphingobacterium multivorum]SUJ24063.1 putative endoribonuclease L-PSP [Sphingobacterium multivorum]